MNKTPAIVFHYALYANDCTGVGTYSVNESGQVVTVSPFAWGEQPMVQTDGGSLEVMRNDGSPSVVIEFSGDDHRLLEASGDTNALMLAIAGGKDPNEAFAEALRQAGN